MNTECGSAVRRNLLPGERVMGTTRLTWAIYLGPQFGVVFGIVLAVAGFILVGRYQVQDELLRTVAPIPGGLIALASLLTLFGKWVDRATTEFVCTDRRVLIKTGLIVTHLEEMLLTKVEAIRFDQGLVGKMMGFASLTVTGSGGTNRKCANIERPHDFYRYVQEQVAITQGH
jgi:uncharacterized membrane protein YdbT with pleckstrin-like domain